MSNNVVMTVVSAVSLVLLLGTLAMQFMEMQTYLMFWFEKLTWMLKLHDPCKRVMEFFSVFKSVCCPVIWNSLLNSESWWWKKWIFVRKIFSGYFCWSDFWCQYLFCWSPVLQHPAAMNSPNRKRKRNIQTGHSTGELNGKSTPTVQILSGIDSCIKQ